MSTLDMSVLQQPVLSLDIMSALHKPVLQPDSGHMYLFYSRLSCLDGAYSSLCCHWTRAVHGSLQQPVRPLDVSVQQQHMLPLNLSVQQQSLMSLEESVLKQTLLTGCVNSIAAFAALPFSSLTASVFSSIADCAVSGRLWQPRANAASGWFCS